MSSHREAPEISKDPAADSTDLYAFVSPDNPDTVTIIANYVPLQAPDGGPNFYEFGDDVLYEIHIDNDGDAKGNVIYQFKFTSRLTNPNTFLYNTGPIAVKGNGRLDTSNWNRRQFFSVTRIVNGNSREIATNLACPPCNIGPLSTPDYATDGPNGGPDKLTKQFIYTLPTGEKVFAGQRAEGFYVDLGAIFDLGQIRPISQAHFGGLDKMPSVNSTAAVNVHSIAIQVPKTQLTPGRINPTDASARTSVIGVYTSASRQKVKMLGTQGVDTYSGAYQQVSRMANPLFNEVLVPISKKDAWNYSPPSADSAFAAGVTNPELAQLLPILYSPAGDGAGTAFPNLKALDAKVAAGTASRAELAAILLTGIPAGLIDGFQNFTGTVQSDLLRLNMAIPPTATGADSFSNLGLAGGDAAGFPNGRRVYDDVTTVELKAVAGLLYPLIDSTYKVDDAVGLVDEYLTNDAKDITAKGSVRYLKSFPYLGTPHSGYKTPTTTPAADE
ncbi:DUF4331 domain-containing protein [Jatrophihabitans sp. YIM 134969]